MNETELRSPNPEDIPQLRSLWCTCFPEDADGYCDFFLHRWFRPDRCLVIREQEKVQSMAHLFQAQLLENGQLQGEYLYLYAIGTHPEFRGRGNLGRLLQGCLTLAESRKMAGILLTSAEGLEPLYEHYGLRSCAVRYETHVQLSSVLPLRWAACPYEVYSMLRRQWLSKQPAAFAWQPESDRFFYEVQCASGSVMHWQENGREYYAVTGEEAGVPVLLETNHPLDSGFLDQVGAAMGCGTVLKVCSPKPFCPDSHPMSYGHWLPISNASPDFPGIYLNLIAD